MILSLVFTKLNKTLKHTAEFGTGSTRWGWVPATFFNHYHTASYRRTVPIVS